MHHEKLSLCTKCALMGHVEGASTPKPETLSVCTSTEQATVDLTPRIFGGHVVIPGIFQENAPQPTDKSESSTCLAPRQ